jgi:hypothetical protein
VTKTITKQFTIVQHDRDLTDGDSVSEVTPFDLCYPEGVPEEFPVALFDPIPQDAFVVRDAALRARIETLEETLLTCEQVDMPTDDQFADGVYVRTLFMPKGSVVVGRVHLRECINIMVTGDITLLTVDGPVRLKAPQIFKSAAGTKKVAYINEDTAWATTHSLEPMSSDEAMDALSVPTFKQYDALIAAQTQELLS